MLRIATITLTVAAMTLVFAVAAGGGTDQKVNADTDASEQNEPSITINHHYLGDPLNIVVAYNDIGKSLGASWSPDSGQTWTDVQLPLVYSYSTGDPSVASDLNGHVYACFLSYEGTPFLGKSGIYVSKSTDGGRSWGSAVPVDTQLYPGSGPPVPFVDKCMMTVDTNSGSFYSNNIYVAWQRDNTDGIHSAIYFARSIDGGVTFSTPMKINDNPSGTAFCEGAFPFVGADGDVYVTWYNSYFHGHEPGSLYVAKSVDGGVNFGPDVKVANFLAPPKYTYSNTGFKAKSFPSAAADPTDPDKLYITYIGDPDGYFDRRLDNGKAPGVPGSTPSDWPVIERNGNNVYVAWRDYRNGGGQDIYFNWSTDNGQTWGLSDVGPLDNGDTPGANNSWWQRLSSSGTHVYCVWEDYRNGGSNVFFNRSSTYGQSWMTDAQIDGAPAGAAGAPAIASTGNHVYVAWRDLRNGGGDIYFTYSSNNGVSFSTPARIDLGDSPGANGSWSARLACQGNYVYCMWADDRSGGTAQIYFNYSANNGMTWQASSQQLSQGLGQHCGVPVRGGLKCTSTYVYACWEDDRDTSGQYNIFFNRSANNGLTWGTDIRISDSGYYCAMPFMEIEGNYVYIAWQDNRMTGGFGMDDIWFDYSSNNGATWQTPDVGPIDVGGVGIYGGVVEIAAEGSNVYATWLDSRRWGGLASDIFFNRSTDHGATWTSDLLINLGSYPAALVNNHPVMSAGNGFVNIVWPDPRIWGLPNIYTSYSTDSGVTWLAGPDEADVYCVRSVNGGATWSSPVTVNDDGTTWAQVLPWVVVKKNGLVDISFYDFRFTPANPQFPGAQLRLATSTNGALSFQPSFPIQDTVVTPMTQWVGEYNGMAVLDSFVFTVFTDNERTGNSDIFIDQSINPTLPPDTSSVRLDGITGPGAQGVQPGEVACGKQFVFNIRLTNSTSAYIERIGHAFRVYSPDGADIADQAWRWNMDIDWFGLYLDGGGGIGVMGPHADTGWFQAEVADSNGIPDGLSEIIILDSTSCDCADTNKTICIDTSGIPGSFWWWWTPGGYVYPGWDGPHCFTIVAVECCNHDGIRGDVSYDLTGPNIVDLTYLVAYLFGGGLPPPCSEEGDANADGAVNIVDVTYLVAYLFGGGPAPQPCP